MSPREPGISSSRRDPEHAVMLARLEFMNLEAESLDDNRIREWFELVDLEIDLPRPDPRHA